MKKAIIFFAVLFGPCLFADTPPPKSLKIPGNNPGTNGQCLKTDGIGSTTWASCGGGSTLPNDTFLDGTNSSNTGTVPLIKVDDGDDIQIGEKTPDTTFAHIKIGGVENQGGFQYTGIDIRPRTHRIDMVAGATGEGGQINMLADYFSVYSNGSNSPRFLISDINANNFIYVKTPNVLSGSWTWTWPDNDGNNGECLKTNGSGVSSWGSCGGGGGGGSPGGVSGNFQYNDGAGGFGGASEINYNTNGFLFDITDSGGFNGIQINTPYVATLRFNNTQNAGPGIRRNWALETESGIGAGEAGSFQVLVSSSFGTAPDTYVMQFLKNGNVGIGPNMSVPSEMLEVESNAYIHGNIYTLGVIKTPDAAGSSNLSIATGDGVSGGSSGAINIFPGSPDTGGNGGNLNIGAHDGGGNGTTGGDVNITAGGNSGTGSAGSVFITSGDASSSHGGIFLDPQSDKIYFQNANEGTAGHIWTSTDTNGGGHWAALSEVGDISSVIAGTGLVGGGTSGDVTINISSVTPAQLTQSGAATNEVLKWNGSAWAHATDADSGGDITSVVAGTGLSGGGTSGAVTLSLAPNSNAATATALAADPTDCGSDTYATAIAASGNLSCSTVTNAGLAGSIAASKLIGTDIATVGTITTGIWSATTIAANKGGTGNTTNTNHGVLIGQGSSAIAATSAGTSGQPLLSGGSSADPNWGTLGIGAGGTGQTTAQAALDALLPTQTGHSGEFLTTDGTNGAWSGGKPGKIVATFDATSQTANISIATLYNVPAAAHMYRIFCSMELTGTASVSSTLGTCQVNFTSHDSNQNFTKIATGSANTSANVFGAMSSGQFLFKAKASTTISYITSGYASSGSPAMNYAAHFILEQMD